MPILNDILSHEVIGPAILQGRQEGRQEILRTLSQSGSVPFRIGLRLVLPAPPHPNWTILRCVYWIRLVLKTCSEASNNRQRYSFAAGPAISSTQRRLMVASCRLPERGCAIAFSVHLPWPAGTSKSTSIVVCPSAATVNG